MFGMKTPKMGAPVHQAKPALNMPGLRRGSMPGLGQRAVMPHLTGGMGPQGPQYQDVLREKLMAGLKPR